MTAEKRNFPRIVVTGGIASGKSAVCEILASEGFRIVNADRVAEFVMTRPDIASQLVERFGNDIIKGDGIIDKETRRRILLDHVERHALNSIVIPAAMETVLDMIRKGGRMTVAEVPMLFDSHYECRFDVVICVYADRDTQIRRLTGRHPERDADEIAKRVDIQMPNADIAKYSHVLFRNNDGDGDLAEKAQRLAAYLQGFNDAYVVGEANQWTV